MLVPAYTSGVDSMDVSVEDGEVLGSEAQVVDTGVGRQLW